MKRYNPTDIEQKWQAKWEQDGTYVVDLDDRSRPKYLGFSMLPGITGAGIHIGHGRTFQFSDIKVRAKRQQGFNAYHPIGWDSFGLPVENYAIKIGKKPREAHDEAKANFIRQLKRLGYSYDWTKEISTADPEYYKWTQWIFTQLYKHNLAYQKESPQWWCEHDQTVLANEQVEGGKCWRCGNPVTKKNLNQWFFKITEYADEMLEATDALDWTDMVKTMQKNWIGKSQGAEVEFNIHGSSDILTVFTTRPDTLFGATFVVLAPEHELVSSLATDQTRQAVDDYVAASARKSEIERMSDSKEKTGVFTGSYAINPVNGEKVPIWVADYVLAGYGTGAVMAVPAHDERDGAFARAFGLPIVNVVNPSVIRDDAKDKDVDVKKGKVVAVVTNDKGELLTINWGEKGGRLFVGGTVEGDESAETTALREVTEETGYTNLEVESVGAETFHYTYYAFSKNEIHETDVTFVKLRLMSDAQQEQHLDESEKGNFAVEWVSTVQAAQDITEPLHRYAYDKFIEHKVFHGEGTLENSGQFDGMQSSDAREEIVAWLEQQGVGRNKTTFKMRDWLISRQRYWGAPIPIVHVKDYGAVAVPDSQLPVVLPDVDDYKPKGGATSVLATVEDWVHIWYNLDTGDFVPFSEPKPQGDNWHEAHRETDTLDGYACSSWYFLRYIDPFNADAPWDIDRAQHWQSVDFYNGADHAVAHLLYSRFWMRFFYKLGLVPTPEPFKRMMYNAYIMAPDGSKMSKSKGNVIDPLEIMDSGYGADSLRVYEMFIAPYDLDAPWDTRGVPGTYRFLNRVWALVQDYLDATNTDVSEATAKEILRHAHATIKKVTSDIEDDKFNTAISSMMEMVNALYRVKESVGIAHNDTWKFALESLLQVLAPFAPHITEELWQDLGHTDTIHRDHWPAWDDAYLVSDTMTIIVQVNGKLRAKLDVPADTAKEEIEKLAQADDHVQTFVDGKEPKKIIYVPGKLINIVV